MRVEEVETSALALVAFQAHAGLVFYSKLAEPRSPWGFNEECLRQGCDFSLGLLTLSLDLCLPQVTQLAWV